MKTTPPTPFSGSEVAESRHVRAFFNGEEEFYQVLMPFIQGGFACGDREVHVVSPGQHPTHRQRLTAAGIDMESAEQSGLLQVRTNTETYLRNGRFDQDRMNPFFVPPEEFLPELRERRSRRTAAG